ncbi:MAG TPA: type I DNA topoisomerase [Clostridiales bacterium]|nr:MAG: DNA topoisomerase I [Clostridiales bacterium GWD2_32_19]HCC07617.1 type I DNA topoisomerase [Clostridiales bacterium]
MSKYLLIVESPAKSKTIGKFLGKDYKIDASMGHIRDLPKSKLGIDIENDFEPQYINIRGKAPLIKKLKQEAAKSEKVFLATDPDREGEAISWHLMNALKLDESKTFRITFNEITKNAVTEAVTNARNINMDLVDAQQTRRILDRIVGYKISPLLWKKVAKGLSAGRVQSVALRLVCDREEEIEHFVKEEYWSLKAQLIKGKAKTSFEAVLHGKNSKKIKITNADEMKDILKYIKKQEFIVKAVKRGEKHKNSLPPFITSTLQQTAFSKLNFTPSKTMQIAQQLYEGIDIQGEGHVGLITYMRTDSTRLSEEFKTDAKTYINQKYGNDYVSKTDPVYKSKGRSQDAHEAVRITDVNKTPNMLAESLTKDQYKLYKLIWERSVASQMASAVYSTHGVDIDAGEYNFKATGSTIKFDGFLKVYNFEESEEAKNPIPELEQGEKVNLKTLDEKQHFTEPPPRFTEASLVKILEENGIGRPSTYAATISTILIRRYVTKEGKSLIPTELGNIVNGIMENHFENIVDVHFTAKLERELDEIADGKANWKETIREFYEGFSPILELAETTIGKIEIKVEVTDILCEKCGKNMVVKRGRFGDFLACPGFPECKNAKPIKKEIGVKCPKCNGEILEKKSKKGILYYGCEHNPECDFLTWNKPLNEKCPECGDMLVEKGRKNKAVVCNNSKCEYKK